MGASRVLHPQNLVFPHICSTLIVLIGVVVLMKRNDNLPSRQIWDGGRFLCRQLGVVTPPTNCFNHARETN